MAAGRQRQNGSDSFHAPEVSQETPLWQTSFPLIRRQWLKFLCVSVILLAPCFWHRRIEAGDLGSHLYNAWLVQWIHHGEAPGVWIASQGNNVLFDFLLSSLTSLFGFSAGEKLAVSACVLIFFWGAFALVCAAARRVPWFLLPCVAMIAYGWTFHAGFFNYYIALGLSFLALAIFWRGKGWERLIPLALVPLILLAHPLGIVWLFAAAGYIWIAGSVSRRYHIPLLIAAAGLLFMLRSYLGHHYPTGNPVSPRYLINGADQFILFGTRYFFLALAAPLFGLAAFVRDAVRRRRDPEYWAQLAIPLQLYVLVELGVILLPASIYSPHYGSEIGLLLERLSLISATLGCCILGVIEARKWHVAGFAAIAAVFFLFVHQDERTLNRMEEQVERMVGTLPQGARVMETILAPPDWRVTFINHIVDRACIGRCFAYGNYEPASRQFRVRASPGNGIVLTSPVEVEAMEKGNYIVRTEDLPAYQIYQCGADFSDLCIRKLEAGEKNDRLGAHRNR